MLTVEAHVEGKKVDSLCLTDPHDGGDRERNRAKTDKWEAEVRAKFPNKKIDFPFFCD